MAMQNVFKPRITNEAASVLLEKLDINCLSWISILLNLKSFFEKSDHKERERVMQLRREPRSEIWLLIL